MTRKTCVFNLDCLTPLYCHPAKGRAWFAVVVYWASLVLLGLYCLSTTERYYNEAKNYFTHEVN